MKQIITILVLFIWFGSNAQHENIFLSRTDKILYVGFDNLLGLGFKDSIIEPMTVECEGCEYDIIKEARGYVIPVTKEGEIILSFYNRGELIQTSKFNCVFPPEPTIFINDSIPLESMDESGVYFNLKMPNYTAIRPQYHIAEWTIVVGKKTFHGKGKNITVELNEYIRSLKKPTPAKISIEFTFGKKQSIEREFVLNN